MPSASQSSRNRGAVVWFTGLPGSGKSTLARALVRHLQTQALPVESLDGDAVRARLSQGLGFSRQDRETNVMRIAFVAELLVRHDVWVVVAAISPFRDARDRVRGMFERFVEVHVSTPLEVCKARDVNGLYTKAIAGQLENFTGVSDPYESPLSPELRLDTSVASVDDNLVRLLATLSGLGYLAAPSER